MMSTRIFTALLCFLFLAFVCTSCEKEYSYEGGPGTGISEGTAVYILQGEGGNCTVPSINQTFTSGVALQSFNTITLKVNVIVTGTYTLTTNVVDGIQFSSSGNFSVIGPQTIILKGSGTPVTAGTFPFTPSVGSGCIFFVTVQQGLQPANFELEGEPGSCFDFSVNGNYNTGSPLTIDNTVQVMVNVLSVGSYSIKTAVTNGISFLSSGNFTSTGSQQLILYGSGTPINTGKFNFKPNSSSSTCSFDITCTNVGPPANYELTANNDGTCSNYSVPGSFYHGTPLNNNIMSVTVNVIAPGNFTIGTNTVNGMTFSVTGTFTTTGKQSVKLTGRGTPVDVGIFSFRPQIVGAYSNNIACNLDVYVF
jgi:hypothetical protein